jgi:hypothetical protein
MVRRDVFLYDGVLDAGSGTGDEHLGIGTQWDGTPYLGDDSFND